MANYSSDELEAFSISDKLGDGQNIDPDTIRRVLGALACEGERTRTHLERALAALGDPQKRKRESVHDLICAERQ